MAAVLVGISLTSDDPATVGVCFQVLPYAVWPMLVAALSTLTTGLLLGWGTAYGILQRWWVVIKLALTVLMSVLIVVALRPGWTRSLLAEGISWPVARSTLLRATWSSHRSCR